MAKQKKTRRHAPATCWLHLAGYTATELAEHLGISQERVSTMLQGKSPLHPRFRKGLVELTDEKAAQKVIDAIPESIRDLATSPRFRKVLMDLTDEATTQKIIDAIPAPTTYGGRR